MRKVVVVGAELAGLAAARRLVALGRDVTTVEGSRDRVGGRSEGILLEDGTPPLGEPILPSRGSPWHI